MSASTHTRRSRTPLRCLRAVVAGAAALALGCATVDDALHPYAAPLPAPCPPALREWLGEYGAEGTGFLLFEQDGRLHARLGQANAVALEGRAPGPFRFPEGGVRAGAELLFERGNFGRVARIRIAGFPFERRWLDGENDETFRIVPLATMDVLRRDAANATPPLETDKLPADLVDLRAIEGLRFDIRYATTNNFLGAALYGAPEAWAQRPVAAALVRVRDRLARQNLGLLIHDAFRPWRVTKMFWDATPEHLREFVADPAEGSRHNRGCAIDLTLYDRATGAPVPMVSGYDEFSPRASPDYPGGTARERWYRGVLRHAMEAEGFTVYPGEWWHFDFEGWRDYPIIEDFPSSKAGR